jgi:hypothetical protein
MTNNGSATGFVSSAPATGSSVPALIPPLDAPKPDAKNEHSRRLSVQGWLTIAVCLGAAMVYLSVALQSMVVFIIGEGICLLIAPFVLWAERGNIYAWYHARGKCPDCGFNLHKVKGPCPQCGRKRIVD